MSIKNQWVVIATDGDVDYTDIYEAESVTNEDEARELLNTLPEYDDSGLFFAVVRVKDAAALQDRIRPE